MAELNTPVVSYSGDFRSAAVAASEAALEGAGVVSVVDDLTVAGFSVCVPARHDREGVRARLRRDLMIHQVVVMACLGLTWLSVFGGMFLVANGSPRVGAAMVVGGLFGGLLSMVVIGPMNIPTFLTRRRLRQVAVPKPSLAVSEPVWMVCIENPESRSKMKLVGEDRALLYCDGARRLLVMEGISHRYVIRAADVVGLRVSYHLLSQFVIVSYRVAESQTVLQLTLVRPGFFSELKRQWTLNMTKPAMVGILERTFGMRFPYEVPVVAAVGGA